MTQEYRQKLLQRLIHTTLERKRESPSSDWNLVSVPLAHRHSNLPPPSMVAAGGGGKNAANLATSGVALAEVLPKVPP